MNQTIQVEGWKPVGEGAASRSPRLASLWRRLLTLLEAFAAVPALEPLEALPECAQDLWAEMSAWQATEMFQYFGFWPGVPIMPVGDPSITEIPQRGS